MDLLADRKVTILSLNHKCKGNDCNSLEVTNWLFKINSREKNNCCCTAETEAADHRRDEESQWNCRLSFFLKKRCIMCTLLLLEAFLCSRCYAAHSCKSALDIHAGREARWTGWYSSGCWDKASSFMMGQLRARQMAGCIVMFWQAYSSDFVMTC